MEINTIWETIACFIQSKAKGAQRNGSESEREQEKPGNKLKFNLSKRVEKRTRPTTTVR